MASKSKLTSHFEAIVQQQSDHLLVTYLANTTTKPSPGCRALYHVIPHHPYILDITAHLIKGDRAFIYCESQKKANRYISRTNILTPNHLQPQTFQLRFTPDEPQIYLGILFFGPQTTSELKIYHFEIRPDPTVIISTPKSHPPINWRPILNILKGQNSQQSSKLAVIVEPRADPFLVQIVNHYLDTLPTDWRVQIFHGDLNKTLLAPFTKYPRVKLTHLPITNLTREEYSRLLLFPEFYQSCSGQHLLFFQLDTCLNPKHVNKLNNYLQYDYVGAPWKKMRSLLNPSKFLHIGNGGLSLRRRQTMIKATSLLELPRHRELIGHHEDQVICSILYSRLLSNVKLPPINLAREFSVESIPHPDPIGVHQAWKFIDQSDFAQMRRNNPTIDILFKGRFY